MTRQLYTQTATVNAVALIYDTSEAEAGEQWFAANPLYRLQLLGTTDFGDGAEARAYRVSYRAKKANRDDISRRFKRAFGAMYSVVEPFAEITDKVPYAAS